MQAAGETKKESGIKITHGVSYDNPAHRNSAATLRKGSCREELARR